MDDMTKSISTQSLSISSYHTYSVCGSVDLEPNIIQRTFTLIYDLNDDGTLNTYKC